MPDQSPPTLPGVINKLGKMTALRDTYLVEQSLLRTLGPIVGVLNSWLYRIDSNGVVIRSLRHSRSVIADPDGTRHISEQIDENTGELDLPEEVLSLLNNVRLLEKPCTSKMEDGFRICYPLKGDKELCGYFLFERDHLVTPQEDATVHGVLEVFTNYHALLDTSQRDRLTGLLNRYSLDMNLDRLWHLMAARLAEVNAEGNRRNLNISKYWLTVIDIDHFKRINDTYGHQIGDEVLIIASRLLQDALRSTDLLYRYGGEEFIAVVVANDQAAAMAIFERARKNIEAFQFPQAGTVTISGGFCGAEPTMLPNEIISRADRAMYEAKRDGRNRIYYYDTLVEQGVLQRSPLGDIELF